MNLFLAGFSTYAILLAKFIGGQENYFSNTFFLATVYHGLLIFGIQRQVQVQIGGI